MRLGIVLSALVFFVPAGSAQADPAARTREMAEVMKAIVSAPEGGALTQEQTAANCRRFAELDGFFDYDAIIGTALASVKDKMDEAELAAFNAKFRELIRMIAYPDSGAFFRRAKTATSKTKVEGNRATVEQKSSIEEEDFHNTVRYAWTKQGETWRIADIAFDGASLAKDYQNQFKRIVDKEGAAGLLKRIDAKYAEEKAKRPVCGK